MNSLASCTWPATSLHQAVEQLARAAGRVGPGAFPPAPESIARANVEVLEGWLDAALQPAGLECDPVTSQYWEMEKTLRHAGPALVRFELDGQPRFAALLGGARGGRVRLLGPDLRRHQVPLDELVDAICAPSLRRSAPDVEALVEQLKVDPSRRPHLRRALSRQISLELVEGIFLIRALASQSLWSQLKSSSHGRDLPLMAVLHALAYGLLVASWVIVGRATFLGHLEPSGLVAWVLLLATLIPCHLSVTWLQGRFAIGLGAILKQRLLYGAMNVSLDHIRDKGVGRLIGHVVEAEAFEELALGGGPLAILAVLELALAGWVLGQGAGGLVHSLILLGWAGLAGLWAWRLYRRRREWSAMRVALTERLIEKMVGHRTVLAQLPRNHRHDDEDQQLEQYLQLGRAMDLGERQLSSWIPRGWMLVGVMSLAPMLLSGEASSAAVATSLGGVWLAFAAFSKMVTSLYEVGAAAVGWEQIRQIDQAAAEAHARFAGASPVAATAVAHAEEPREPLIVARNLRFGYPGRRAEVLKGCSVRIEDGERLLLEGSSGSGKSTLASVISGLRQPTQGLLLLRGLDRTTVGERSWRRRVAVAPQFHENHVFSSTFAFNLLMGRRWPASPQDLEEAEELCQALGLGPLLERMPSGLMQPVGESGWQLSHGERSRMFLARALLQGADLIVLDESFAALDPESMEQTLSTVMTRAPTLLVIAHP